jgi:xanthine dehydrogenase accessory factor
MKELREIVGRLGVGEPGAVMATLVCVEGSSYRRPGARLLVTGAGNRIGSISGGCLEEDLVERCLRVRTSGRAELAVYDTTMDNDQIWGVGMGCHGVVRILVEPLANRPEWAQVLAENIRHGRVTRLAVAWDERGGPVGTRLASPGPDSPPLGVFLQEVEAPTALTIFGAGDDAQPLARIAIELGWNVTVCDPRPALATESRFPGLNALVLGPAGELVGRSGIAPGSFAVVMTHHYRHDVPILRQLLALPLDYIGLLGPKRRADQILSDLARDGLVITAEMVERLRAPVGLDLGADSPEEVALSIVAEMRSVLSGRNGRPLRERALPIHA